LEPHLLPTRVQMSIFFPSYCFVCRGFGTFGACLYHWFRLNRSVVKAVITACCIGRRVRDRLPLAFSFIAASLPRTALSTPSLATAYRRTHRREKNSSSSRGRWRRGEGGRRHLLPKEDGSGEQDLGASSSPYRGGLQRHPTPTGGMPAASAAAQRQRALRRRDRLPPR
jgi:hypothetical protein